MDSEYYGRTESVDTDDGLRCLYCGYMGAVTYYDWAGDAYCEKCGHWQLD